MELKLNKSKGFVLVTALVFLIALTAVASMLVLNTTTDMKMSGASQEKVIAAQEAFSAVDEVILIQTTGTNLFVGTAFPKDVAVGDDETSATITSSSMNNLAVTCPASTSPSSIFKCNVLSIQVTRNYGNNASNNISVNAGIAQQLLNIGGQ